MLLSCLGQRFNEVCLVLHVHKSPVEQEEGRQSTEANVNISTTALSRVCTTFSPNRGNGFSGTDCLSGLDTAVMCHSRRLHSKGNFCALFIETISFL